jgi:hypothetical protein
METLQVLSKIQEIASSTCFHAAYFTFSLNFATRKDSRDLNAKNAETVAATVVVPIQKFKKQTN